MVDSKVLLKEHPKALRMEVTREIKKVFLMAERRVDSKAGLKAAKVGLKVDERVGKWEIF